MTIVVDTSVIIDNLRMHPLALEAVDDAVVRGERVVASVLTRVEILSGMRPAEEAATRELLDALEWIEVSDEIAERAGVLANCYLRTHPGIDPVDYVIAATVDRLDAKLWTRNVKHFPMFERLQLPY